MRYERLSRIAGLISAALVATVTFAVAARAVQTITTPNAFTASYSLGPGDNSRAFTLLANIPTFVMGDSTLAAPPGFFNIGSSDMTVFSSRGGHELVWNGLESNGGGVTSGSGSVPGTHMIFIDGSHCVDLEVNSATSFKVHNGCAAGLGTMTGFVTEIW
jgi:hypothetical protein